MFAAALTVHDICVVPAGHDAELELDEVRVIVPLVCVTAVGVIVFGATGVRVIVWTRVYSDEVFVPPPVGERVKVVAVFEISVGLLTVLVGL